MTHPTDTGLTILNPSINSNNYNTSSNNNMNTSSSISSVLSNNSIKQINMTEGSINGTNHCQPCNITGTGTTLGATNIPRSTTPTPILSLTTTAPSYNVTGDTSTNMKDMQHDKLQQESYGNNFFLIFF